MAATEPCVPSLRHREAQAWAAGPPAQAAGTHLTRGHRSPAASVVVRSVGNGYWRSAVTVLIKVARSSVSHDPRPRPALLVATYQLSVSSEKRSSISSMISSLMRWNLIVFGVGDQAPLRTVRGRRLADPLLVDCAQFGFQLIAVALAVRLATRLSFLVSNALVA